MIRKRWFAVGAIALSSIGVVVPSTVLAQHGPGRHGPGPGLHARPAYDAKSEATFKGVVVEVKTGRSALDRLIQIHTLGQGQTAVQEKQLLLKTDTGTLEIELGPTAFLDDKKVEIRKGDTLEVIGSRVTSGEAHLVLAREIRKGNNVWLLRDATGQPLWRSAQTEARGFWTTKRVLLAVIAIKVVALATVLRH